MDKTPKHGGTRKGAGRAPENADARVTVRLNAERLAIATRLGSGDVSAGIRMALDAAKSSRSPLVTLMIEVEQLRRDNAAFKSRESAAEK